MIRKLLAGTVLAAVSVVAIPAIAQAETWQTIDHYKDDVNCVNHIRFHNISYHATIWNNGSVVSSYWSIWSYNEQYGSC